MIINFYVVNQSNCYENVAKTLILLLFVDICDIGIDIILWSNITKKRISTFVFNFASFVVLKLFMGTKFGENDEKPQKM